MSFTVRDFVYQMYRLINASNPTIPLHGDDEKLAIQVLNQLLQSYASSGLMMTIAKTVSAPILESQNLIYFVDSNYSTSTTIKEIVTLTAASPSFTVVNGTLYFAGDTVTGGGIPAAASILSIVGNTITLNVNATTTGASALYFTHDTSDPAVAYIRHGRLANLDNAWLVLSGVTYPLIDKSRDEFLSAWKYEPLMGLPRFIITLPDTDKVVAQLYPGASQAYEFYCRGKFQISRLTSSDDMSVVPEYYHLYFLYAVGKYVSKFKGRGSAWTADLEAEYRELKDNMEAASEVNLSITGDQQSMLNGAWRVRAGI